MKRLVSLSAAALLLAACSESTAPTSNLATRENKPVSPPPTVAVQGNLTNDTFTFEDESITSAGGATFSEEATGPGSVTAAAPTVTDAYNHSTHFLGRASNNAIFLNVPNGGSTYALSFDLYLIGSWDGQGQQAQNGTFGQDIWRLSIRCGSQDATASTILLETDFSNQLTVQQSYPGAATQKGGYKAATGSYGQDLLGFRFDPNNNTPQFRSFGDTEYQMSFSGANPCPSTGPTYFVFLAPYGNLQGNYDESWGIDNVSIKTDQ
jgi:hypothetical protein